MKQFPSSELLDDETFMFKVFNKSQTITKQDYLFG